MKLTGTIRRRIALYSMAALIGPMVAFPYQFGTELMQASFINALFELVFYGVMVFAFYRKVTLSRLLQAGGACLAFRFGMGAAFGALVFIIYGLELDMAVKLGMSGYLPAIIVHIVAVPFIIKPVLSQIYDPLEEAGTTSDAIQSAPKIENQVKSVAQGRTSIAISKSKGFVSSKNEQRPVSDTGKLAAATNEKEDSFITRRGDIDGFERAIKYVAEHGAVEVACVVDSEGLMMAHIQRGTFAAEDWAPLSSLFLKCNEEVLKKCDLGLPEKLDILVNDKRIIIAQVGNFILQVVAERQSDDFLNIRIGQAVDMIAKYVKAKYSYSVKENGEKSHA